MSANRTHATQPQFECEERKRIVFVRGSGQDYEKSKELDKLRESLELNIDDELYVLDELENTINFLKTEPEYKSIAVFGSLSNTLNGGAAIIFQSSFGKYRQSVSSGKNLLEKYIRHYAELGVCVIPVGYSQGAQVVGEVLMELEDEPWVLSKIKYVGLLGDPKLDLYGIDIIPGKNIPWYRGNAVPLIQEGILENRSPYIPVEGSIPRVTVSSWCYDDDLICTSNYAGGIIDNGHSKYPSRSIPSMATEIAAIINPASGNTLSYSKQICSIPKQDIVILLDISPLMRRDVKLFTDTPMYDPFHLSPQGTKLPPRTAGQMLTSVGCGDTKIAVVGYGLPTDGPPRLLLDFTSDAGAYDSLMKSLYEPSSSGIYDRTQFREGVTEALNVNWREGANRTIYVLTDIAGSGPDWGGGTSGHVDSLKQDRYRKDVITQQILSEARSKKTVIWGLPIRHSYAGYTRATPTSGGDAKSYLNMFTEHTGGYNWNKEWINYGEYNFKFTRLHDTVNEALQRREKMMATVTPLRGISGESVTVKLMDTVSVLAGAKLRNESASYRWYVDCGDKTMYTSTNTAELTFTPVSPQKCIGTVIASIKNMTGNGCYSGCPEPFPPNTVRSFPFIIDIKPTDYVPKIPTVITDIHKTIYDDRVEYAWNEPALNGSESVAYVIREQDGHVLAVTTTRQLTIEQTEGNDPVIGIMAAGTDGASTPILSSDIATVDMRTADLPGVFELPYFESKDPVEQPATPAEINISAPVTDTTVESGIKEQALTVIDSDAYTANELSSVLQRASILPRALGYSIDNTSSGRLLPDRQDTPEKDIIMKRLGISRALQPRNITVAMQGGDMLLAAVIAGILGGALGFRKTLKIK